MPYILEDEAPQSSGYVLEPAPQEQLPSALDETSFGNRVLAGMGQSFVNTGRGLKGLGLEVADLLAPRQQGLRSLITGKQPSRAEEYRASYADEAPYAADLASSGGGLLGNVAGGVSQLVGPGALLGVAGKAAQLPKLVAAGRAIAAPNTYKAAIGTGVAQAAAQPAEGLLDRAVNAGIGGLFGAVGQRFGNAIAKPSIVTPQQSARQSAVNAARQQGYAIPPASMNPESSAANLLEGFAGKLTTAQQASMKNQGVTNKLVAQDLGLPPDVPITPDSLAALRRQAGQAYESLATTGRVVTDQKFADDLTQVLGRNTAVERDFPELANTDLVGIVQSVAKPEFDASSAVSALSLLREKADKAFASGDKGYGNAIKSVASAVEDQLERHAAALGDPAAVQSLRDARQLIAKTYSAQKALNPSTSNINAAKFAKDFEKGRLSGGMKEAAAFQRAFPAAARETTTSMPGLSPLDFAVGGISAASASNPLLLAAVGARPAIRTGILSSGGQSLLAPNYGKMMAPALAGTQGTISRALQSGLMASKNAMSYDPQASMIEQQSAQNAETDQRLGLLSQQLQQQSSLLGN